MRYRAMIVTVCGELERTYLVPEDACTDEEVGRVQRAVTGEGVRLHNRVTDVVADLASLEDRIRKHFREEAEELDADPDPDDVPMGGGGADDDD